MDVKEFLKDLEKREKEGKKHEELWALLQEYMNCKRAGE